VELAEFNRERETDLRLPVIAAGRIATLSHESISFLFRSQLMI
jgi:hypothetical protein